jgi:hypothetical protein
MFFFIESFVASHEQLFPAVDMRLQIRESEACGHSGLHLAIDDLGLSDGFAEPLRHCQRLDVLRARQQDSKLVSANASEKIPSTHAALETCGNSDERSIAAVMPEGIVDAFEIIQIHHESA